MLGKHKAKKRYEIRMPLTALIDIVFLLLVYFLLTTNFMVDEGIKIKLPQAKASSPPRPKTKGSPPFNRTICSGPSARVARSTSNALIFS